MKEIIAYEMVADRIPDDQNDITCVPFQEKYWDESGAVSCYGNELDDLIVEEALQRQGIGQKLLIWGMHHIKEQGYEEMILHVAGWNQNAVKLYLKSGFRIRSRETVRQILTQLEKRTKIRKYILEKRTKTRKYILEKRTIK